jgi:hypothetical protein
MPTLDGTRAPKPLHHIMGGILTLSSGWSLPMDDTLLGHLQQDMETALT